MLRLYLRDHSKSGHLHMKRYLCSSVWKEYHFSVSPLRWDVTCSAFFETSIFPCLNETNHNISINGYTGIRDAFEKIFWKSDLVVIFCVK